MIESNHVTGSNDARRQLDELLDLLGEETLTADDRQQLNTILREHPELLGHYLQSTYLHAALTVRGQEMPLPVMEPAALARSASEESIPHAPREEKHHAERDEYYPPTRSVSEAPVSPFRIPHSTFHISAFAAVVAFIAIGILAYSFWPGPAELPVVKQNPAAKIASLTDAKWDSAFSPASGSVLTAGQRLILQSGLAEITFNGQARVMLQGPADFTIVDVATCQLATGWLTAHVPELAKGFKVHTPSGIVTDLGTEFGVYVMTGTEFQPEQTEEEQQPGGGPQQTTPQSPVTEVHVFQGQVDVTAVDQLAQASQSKSQIPNRGTRDSGSSQILSAGQAVTISDNKVQPLPAADPF